MTGSVSPSSSISETGLNVGSSIGGMNAVLGREGDLMLGEVRLGPLVAPVIRVGRRLACPKTEKYDYADNLLHIQTVRHSGFQMQFNPVLKGCR
jgi:hypothetical protein